MFEGIAWYFTTFIVSSFALVCLVIRKISQLTFTCLKSIIETVEKCVKYVFLSLRLNIFYTFASVSIVDFNQVNVNWIIYAFLKSQRTYFQYGNFFLKGLLC